MTILELTEMARPSAKPEGRKQQHRVAWTAKRRENLAQAVARYQRIMKLSDWTITIDWSKPCEKDALATMTPMSDSRHATLKLSAEYVNLTADLQTQVLLHELAHCMLFPIDDLALETVKHAAGKEGAAIYEIAHSAAIERAVDSIADALWSLVEPVSLD